MLKVVLLSTICVTGSARAISCFDYVDSPRFVKHREKVHVPDGFHQIWNAPSSGASLIRNVQGHNVELDVVGHIVESIPGEKEMVNIYYLTEWSWKQYKKGTCPNWITFDPY